MAVKKEHWYSIAGTSLAVAILSGYFLWKLNVIHQEHINRDKEIEAIEYKLLINHINDSLRAEEIERIEKKLDIN